MMKELVTVYQITTEERYCESLHSSFYATDGLDIDIKAVYLDDKTNIGKAKNNAISVCTTPLICFLPINYLVNKEWLIDMLYYHRCINKPGLVGVLNQFIEYTPCVIPTKEYESIDCNVTSKNDVEGLYVAEVEELIKVKGYEEDEEMQPYLDLIMSKKLQLAGLQNAYCQRQFAAAYKLDDLKLIPKKTEEAYERTMNYLNQYAKNIKHTHQNESSK